MRLINDDDAVLAQQKVLLDFPKEDAISHEFERTLLADLSVVSDLHVRAQSVPGMLWGSYMSGEKAGTLQQKRKAICRCLDKT